MLSYPRALPEKSSNGYCASDIGEASNAPLRKEAQ